MSALKSKYALIYSVKNLIQSLENKGSKFKGTLWTFTTPDKCTPDQISVRWRGLMRELKRKIPAFGGVRVYEMHPGGHGVHIHAVIPNYIAVQLVRSISQKHGFGRIHVRALNGNAEQIGRYLSKYFAKGKRCAEFFRKRIWACFGTYEGTKCKEIMIRSSFLDWFKQMCALKEKSINEAMRAISKFRHRRNMQCIYRNKELHWREIDERNEAIRPYLNYKLIFKSHYRFMLACKALWDLYKPLADDPIENHQQALAFDEHSF